MRKCRNTLFLYLFRCPFKIYKGTTQNPGLITNTKKLDTLEQILNKIQCTKPDEKIYAEWDCPQALAVHNYEAVENDELSLWPGDMVNILRKMSDGWYYGERIRDNMCGWFPSSYVQQIMNDHVRAENYRQRFKVMQVCREGGTSRKNFETKILLPPVKIFFAKFLVKNFQRNFSKKFTWKMKKTHALK